MREIVLAQIDANLPRSGPYAAILYNLMRDYPLRPAKGLRPAICMAVCRALGGYDAQALPTAVALELYHNAFLVHDDVEDRSLMRRQKPTLHRQHGEAVAINVGDGLLVSAQESLWGNLEAVGVGRALEVQRTIIQMSKESVEGQALELARVRQCTWNLTDRDYLRMVHKKTSWYSFLAPALLGAILGGATSQQRRWLRLWATLVGAAFQIQDDVLNLAGEQDRTGKEACGDLWEGKHTLILIHTYRCANDVQKARMREALAKPRYLETTQSSTIARNGADVEELLSLVHMYDSLSYASSEGLRRVRRSREFIDAFGCIVGPSRHLSFLQGIMEYIVERDT